MTDDLENYPDVTEANLVALEKTLTGGPMEDADISILSLRRIIATLRRRDAALAERDGEIRRLRERK